MHRQGKSEMTEGGFWVFAYGSLMWRPGFDFAERRLATLHGYRRRFCMTSVHYRGTPEQPGLVLALDADVAGHCAGVVYRVGGQGSEATLAYLRERELVSYAYREITHEVTLDDGRRVEALAYVSDRGHPQYLGGLSLEEQAEVIARAVGPMGPNAEYLMNTVASLDALGVADQDLHRLATLVRVRL
jgi:glutathione-specific gamma-glutamylcyclotransferase